MFQDRGKLPGVEFPAVGKTDQHPNSGRVGRSSPQANRAQVPMKEKIRKKYAKRKRVSRHGQNR